MALILASTTRVDDLQTDYHEAQTTKNEEVFDYTKRGQWLRVAVLGANNGLFSTASLIIGFGAIQKDNKTMILTGIAGLVARACSMAIGEFVPVYSQHDTEMGQILRDQQALHGNVRKWGDLDAKKMKLPSPAIAATVAAMAFALGTVVPLLTVAFVVDYHVRYAVVIVAASFALLGFGWFSIVLGKAPTSKSVVRVLFGGWLAMATTFGLTKLVGSIGLEIQAVDGNILAPALHWPTF